MSEALVIRIHDTAAASWIVVDNNGARSGPVGSGVLSDATASAEGRRVILLVPAVDVTLATPELPARGGSRLLQAVPFALEEQLASDVDALHFALGPRSGDGSRVLVAAVSRHHVDTWLGACAAAGIVVDSMYNEALALPESPNGVALLLDHGSLYVRRGAEPPFVLDARPLSLAFDLALGPAARHLRAQDSAGSQQEAAEGFPDVSAAEPTEESAQSTDVGLAQAAEAISGEHLSLYVAAEEYEQDRFLIEGLRERAATLQVKFLPDGALPLLAVQAAGSRALDLMQGPYAPAAGFATRFRRWRLPAGLAAAALLLLVANQAIGLWQLRGAEKAVDAEIAAIVAQALPGQPVVDARAQMQGVLNANRGGGNGLLATLTVLAQSMAQVPGGKLEAISFRGDGLDLRMTAPTVEAIDGVKQSMSQHGVAVELQSATPRGDLVEGRLQVRWGSA